MKLSPFFILFIAFIIVPDSILFAQEKKKDEEKVWKINIEAGMTLSKGNSRQESIYSKNSVDFNKEKWTNLFKTRLENTTANKERVKERYDVNNQTRYNFSKRNYRLAEFEYIDDRFGGYDYRISETFGYGRDLIKKPNMDLSLQLSGGFRQVKLTNSDKDLTWLVRSTIHFDWKIKDGIRLIENLDISVDNERIITRSDTSFRIVLKNLSESIYLQIGYFLENRSDATEAGVKNTDTTFMNTIGYNF